MKFDIQYLSDSDGTTQAVQLPLPEWEKVLGKLKKYEQSLKIKSDLMEAFKQLELMKKNKLPKQSLTDFLNDL